MNTCLTLKNIDYNTSIKDLTINDIRLIKDKPLQQSLFHLLTFFQPIAFGNLLFNDKNMSFYYGYDINKITIKELKDLLDTKDSLHYSLSSYMGYTRSYASAVSNSGFTIDIDFYKVDKYKDLKPYELIQIMKTDGAFDMLEPNYVIYSGNGLNLVYLLKNINVNTNLSDIQNYINKLNIEKRRSIIKALIKNFSKYGSDEKCHDITRINKMVGSYNYKTGKRVEILDFDKVISRTFSRRTLGHLYNYFVKKRYIVVEEKKKSSKTASKASNTIKTTKTIKTIKTVVKTENNTNNDTVKEYREYKVRIDRITYIRNSHTLNISRLEDFDYLLNTRNNFVGCRNSLLHLYSVYLRKTTDDLDYIYNRIVEINNSFSERIDNIDYLKNQIYSDKLHYNYKNTDIIDMLYITLEEMRNLKTIISDEERYRRNNEKRREKRRQNGLTKREQQKQETINSVKELYLKGYKQVDIVKELNISKGRVSQIIKELKTLNI